MANNGPTKGRRLGPALNRFAAMLMEEAHDMSGLTYEQLDEQLGFPSGRCKEYSLYPRTKKTRAPHADEIQNLENLVARLLRRPAHVLFIENNKLWDSAFPLKSLAVGEPDVKMDLREWDPNDFQIGYDSEWPTYRRLKYNAAAYLQGHSLIEKYLWQWGIFWDTGLLRDPWTRAAQGIAPDVPVESFLPAIMEKMKIQRLQLMALDALGAGNLPITASDEQ